MGVKPEQQQMQMLLTEAITVLCKNGLQYRSHFNVEGLLGITLDDEDVFLVSIKQTVKGGESSDSSVDIQLNKPNFVGKQVGGKAPMSRAKQRKRRKPQIDSIERLTANIPLNNNNPEKKNSNVPYVVKPVSWEDKSNRDRQEDNFDDSASSPGELIVVKEENLTDVERAQMERRYNNEKDKSTHSTTTQQQQQQPPPQQSNNGHPASSAAIYASTNGQLEAPQSSPYHAWEPSYTGTSAPSSDNSQPDNRTFTQQVCTHTFSAPFWGFQG